MVTVFVPFYLLWKKTVENQFFAFPAHFEPEPIDGGFVITFRDVPEAITQADTYNQGLGEASDCLAEAIAAYIDDQRPLPLPSPHNKKKP